jgi:hypothetical protein
MLRFAPSALAGAVTLAVAAPVAAQPSTTMVTPDGPAQRLTVDTPHVQGIRPAASVSQVIYLERCRNTCTVTKGSNNARTNTSTIPKQTTSTIGEFRNSQSQIGAAADAEWSQIVNCVKEVYSPYNVTITDVKPASGTYHEAIVAGAPSEIGYTDPKVLGVAPLTDDCSAIDNVMSFSFANQHPHNADFVLNVCWTASQESAHAFGLDHEYEFVAGRRSACSDPMTYRVDCGGEKFFRNEAATCGEFAPRACKCGQSQNSHLKLSSVFGPGTPTTGDPTITLTRPAASDGMLTADVSAMAGSRRGVAHVDLYFNGYRWKQVPGAGFGSQGQLNPSSYTAVVPGELPNSIVDVKMIAYDDIGGLAESSVVTVVRGAPCDTAATCSEGQKCEAGKCFWDPPVGEIGDACTYPQFCVSGVCNGAPDHGICTQGCVPGVVDACPSGFDCVASSATAGVCSLASAGCCSIGGDDRAWWVQLGLGATVLACAVRRRRPRAR